MDINQLIKAGDAEGIAAFCRENNLVVREGKIIPRDDASAKKAKSLVGFWDQRQQARKILLNSLYGALLNEALRFSDERMGQSVTLTGRSIARHMNAKINEIITGGVYDHTGDAICYADTDSLFRESIIETSIGKRNIESLFLSCPVKKNDLRGKEYAYDPDLKVLSYDTESDQATMQNIEYIYRHRVSKEKWKITDQQGNEIIVTGDHSVMVERQGEIMEMKPRDMLSLDILISVK